MSVRNFARIQIWLAMMLLHRNYGVPYNMMEGYVIHAEAGKTPVHVTSARFIRDNEASIWRTMCKYRERTNKKKQRQKQRQKQKK